VFLIGVPRHTPVTPTLNARYCHNHYPLVDSVAEIWLRLFSFCRVGRRLADGPIPPSSEAYQMSVNKVFLLGLLTLDDGAGRLSRNLDNYQSTLRNAREERRTQDL
jgi:hypothetical protein